MVKTTERSMQYKPTTYASMLLTSAGGSFLLYSVGVINPAQKVICSWIEHVYYTRYHKNISEFYLDFFWSFVVSCCSFGAIFGGLSVKTIAEKLGRRNGLIFNGVIAIIGSVLSLLCKPFALPELLILARVFHGFAMGLASGMSAMYMMEITSSKHRGIAGSLHQVAVAFADWFSMFMGLPEIFGDSRNWPFALAFPGLLSGIMVVVLPFMPESPKFLMLKRSTKAARNAVKKLVSSQDVDTFMKALECEKEKDLSEHEKKGVYKKLISEPDLQKKLMITILAVLAQQATGCGAIFAFSTHMFIKVGVNDQTARFATVAIGVVYFVSTCATLFLIENKGRRTLILFQLIVCGFSLACMSALTHAQQYNNHPFVAYSSIACLIIYMGAYGIGAPIPWMIPNEMFTTKFRSAAVTISTVIVWSIMFIVSISFMPLQQKIGMACSYLPFTLATFACFIGLYKYLPETKHNDKSGEETSLSDISQETMSTSSESDQPKTTV